MDVCYANMKDIDVHMISYVDKFFYIYMILNSCHHDIKKNTKKY